MGGRFPYDRFTRLLPLLKTPIIPPPPPEKAAEVMQLHFVLKGLARPIPDQAEDPAEDVLKGATIEVCGDSKNFAKLGSFHLLCAQLGVETAMSSMPSPVILLFQALGINFRGYNQLR